jgi:acyl-CoA thioester hydrolase
MSYTDFRHRIDLRVRWAEVDMQRVVFNGHYLTYCDVCITEYWRAIGLPFPDAFTALGADPYARKATVEYNAPARYDDELEICCRIARIGRSSLDFQIAIYRKGDPGRVLVDAELVYVNVNPAGGRPAPWPEQLHNAITRFEPRAPEAKHGPH